LIVTDYKNNIKKVDELLDEIDIEMVDQVVERLDLKYSSAGPISSKLTEILEAKYGKTRKGARAEFFKIVPLDRINAILTIASPDIIMEVRRILSKIDDPTPEGKSLLNVYYLENANAEDVVNILTQTQEAMVGAGEREGLEVPQRTEGGGTVVGARFKAEGKDIAITADKSTNSLVIYAKPDDYDSIKEMIQKLDIPRQQVFIEALIMDVQPSEEFLFGTEWEGLRDLGHPLSEDARQGLIGGSINSGELSGLLAGENLGNGFSLGVLGETIRIGGFTFPSLSVLIRAVESLQTADILSKPQLLTLNNETANINIAENRPFETSTTSAPDVGTTSNIEYRDVGIILQITPHINKAGKIRLEVSLEVSNFTGTTGAGDRPFTNRRTIDTFVEFNNGHTVVIGGLIQTQRDFSRGSTPCLGGVPLMGWAFKSVGVTDNRTNLMVFISPKVVETPEDAEALSKEKMKYMEDERNRQIEKIESEKPFFMENDPK
jgi:general secretion pathway protein D